MGWIVRIDLPEIERDLASSALWDVQTTGIAEIGSQPTDVAVGGGRVTLLAGFDDRASAERARGSLGDLANVDHEAWLVSIEAVDNEAWVDPDHYVHVVAAGKALTLEVAGAFGHGGHPTTELALALLAEVGPPGDTLDFGTGTGILALAAAAHGATSVVAVDDDPAALGVAGRNRLHNQETTGSCPVELLDHLPAGSEARFRLIMANVLLNVHREHGAALVRALAPGGALIATGVLDEQRRDVERWYATLQPVRSVTSGDWLGLLLSRPR